MDEVQTGSLLRQWQAHHQLLVLWFAIPMQPAAAVVTLMQRSHSFNVSNVKGLPLEDILRPTGPLGEFCLPASHTKKQQRLQQAAILDIRSVGPNFLVCPQSLHVSSDQACRLRNWSNTGATHVGFELECKVIDLAGI
ncbi:hypothetical protein WJX84_004347 [Apatococcus fuscideae]|uniref:Uncharacterized protein n=1 Tax=Apatococcus fuscideae TaxID=2026836 RepID=A0AAW1RMK6_9CHLO